MPLPLNAIEVLEPIDPRDVVDVPVAISRGPSDAEPPAVLVPGEGVASFTVAVSTEAAAAGVQIVQGSLDGVTYPAPTIDANLIVTFWVTVDPTRRSQALFDGAGVLVGIEITIKTTNNPARVKQRSVALRFRQR